MIKNILILLSVVLAGVWQAMAQHAPGTWRTFPMHGTTFNKVIDSPDKVYYLTGGSLYSYDKVDKETRYYSPGESVSNYGVQQLYYNPAGKYLLITYADSSFDLLYDDGRLVHMPDITNANLMTSKAIRHVSFGKDRIYVGTDFGLVVFDDKDHYVIESGIYNTPVDKIVIAADHIIAKIDNKIYSSPVSARHKTLDSFTLATAPAGIADMLGGEGADFLYLTSGNINKGSFDPATNTVTGSRIQALGGVSLIQPARDGGFFVAGSNGVADISKDFTVTYTAYPAALKSHVVSGWNGAKALWAANAAGIGCFDITSATPVTITDKYIPDGSLMFAAICYVPSPDGSQVYIGSLGNGRSISAATGNSGATYIEKYDWNTGSFTDVSPLYNGKYINEGPVNTILDPYDPSVLYTVTTKIGIRIHRDGELLGSVRYDQTPVDMTWMPWLMGIFLDPEGNLWLGDRNNSMGPDYYILPAAKVKTLRTNAADITKSDWLKANMAQYASDDYRYMLGFSTRKNKNKAIHLGDNGVYYITYDTKGTLTTADDESALSAGFYTQDGNRVTLSFNTCLVEDLKGDFWVGTSEGVFIITDVEQFGKTSELQAIRPKVARNDGTIYADYLLSTDFINFIAVDPNNRKWIATEKSGLFLVSEDGTEILENFTKDNSPLVTNTVYSVYCSPDGNDIFISTPAGMMVYSSTSAPAADDYSEVFAYPNPVRPDYEGWITVQGLMDNSLVKIADAQGNVVASGRSEGGMFVWDGCNAAGERVRSGVYMVLASQYDGSDSSGAVTKIVVIN